MSSEADEEYEIQHYGFSIAELKKETTDMIHDEVDNACKLLVDTIVISPQVDSVVAAEIERKKNVLANNIKELLKESLDEMGSVMTEHFSIPQNVTLQQDQLKLKAMYCDEQQMEETLDKRVQEFTKLDQFHAALNAELETYSNLQHVIQQQAGMLDLAEMALSQQPDPSYIKEEEANLLRDFDHVVSNMIAEMAKGGQGAKKTANKMRGKDDHKLVQGMEKMIPVINKLQNIFNTAGTDRVQLPQVVVVGGQSSGKSSVLESIVGCPCFPRGTGTCTRCPIVLQLIHKDWDDVEYQNMSEKLNAMEWFEFPHLPMGQSIVTDFNQINHIITNEVNRRAGGVKGIVKQELIMRIISPLVIDLTLVDLPGICCNLPEDWPEDTAQQIVDMVTHYTSNPKSIILAVVPASEDTANAVSIHHAKTVDAKSDRTIAVLTKLDLMVAGTDATELLTGQKHKLKLGMVGVVNRSHDDTVKGLSIDESLNNEAKFLAEHYPTMAHANGIPYLKTRLQSLLMKHIEMTLTPLQTQLATMRIEARNQLEKLGTEDTINKSDAMVEIIEEFCNGFRSSIVGKNRHIQKSTLVGGAQINLAFEENLAQNLKKIVPQNDLDDVEILTTIYNSRAIESSVLITEAAYQDLVRDQIKRLEKPALKCASSVNTEILNVMKIWFKFLEKKMKRFPHLAAAIAVEVTDLLNERHLAAQEQLKNYVIVQASFIKTIQMDFNDEMHGLIKQNALAKNELLTTTTDGSHLNFEVEDGRTEIQKKQCEIVRQLVQKHFQIVKAAFQDYCPKAIAHTVIYFMESNIQRRLIGKLHTLEKIDQLVKECETVSEQRKLAQENVQTLDSALEVIRNIVDAEF